MIYRSCAFIFIAASLTNKCASFRSRFRSCWTAAGFELETPASVEKNLLTLLNLLFQTADSTPTSQQKNRQSSTMRVVTPKLSDMSLSLRVKVPKRRVEGFSMGFVIASEHFTEILELYEGKFSSTILYDLACLINWTIKDPSNRSFHQNNTCKIVRDIETKILKTKTKYDFSVSIFSQILSLSRSLCNPTV